MELWDAGDAEVAAGEGQAEGDGDANIFTLQPGRTGDTHTHTHTCKAVEGGT